MVLGEGCGSPGHPRSSTPSLGRDSAPHRTATPLLTLCPHRARGERPTRRLLQSIGTRSPVYLREGEEGRETLLSVAIVNPNNNNNKEKSLQLGAG